MSRISKLVKNAQNYKGIRFKQPPLFRPVGFVTPQTAKDTVAKQLYQSGIISRDDYDKMLGVVFDDDFEPDAETFEGDFFGETFSTFRQSELASYEDYDEPDFAGESVRIRADGTDSETPSVEDRSSGGVSDSSSGTGSNSSKDLGNDPSLQGNTQ